ncbi:MAG: EamA family transporter [Betaproteobacteria bacterium]|nr:EamA family transporter [Betaproteobacteria bacterium]
MRASNLQLFSLCVLIWGTTWIAITFQFGAVAPEISVGYRFLLASAVLSGYCRWRGLPLAFGWRQHRDLLVFGILMFSISYILVYHAETLIVSGMVAVAYSASPMVNMLAARVCFGTPMSRRVAVAALFGVAGITCIFWPEFGALSASRSMGWGVLLAILSVLSSSAGSMSARRNQMLGYSTWSSLAWGMLYGGALAIVIGLAAGQPLTFDSGPGYLLSLAYLAIFGSIVAFASYITLIGRIGVAGAGYTGVMAPIVALTVSFFFEKFAWSWLTTIGVALSALGNVLMLKPMRK